MDYIEFHHLLKFTLDDVENIRKQANFYKKEDRDEGIRLLAEWVRQQEHFIKKEYPKAYLERCIVQSNGSIEAAKRQIDKMCTFRTLMPEYFISNSIMESDVARLFEIGKVAIVPRLTKKYHRVVIMKVYPNVEIMSDVAKLFCHVIILIAEFFKGFDYQTGNYVIIDLYDANIADFVTKFNVFELPKALPIITEGYGGKVKGVVLITPSAIIEKFAALAKTMFSQKIAGRFHVMKSRFDLTKLVEPCEILPTEYGGKEKSFDVLSEELTEYITSPELMQMLAEMNVARTDETKRSNYTFNDLYMGVPGTFRNISLD